MNGTDETGGRDNEFTTYRLNRSKDMIHSELRALYRYWNGIRAGRKTPMRSDIDPREMDCDARNLFILENLGRGNIRFRLAGTALANAFGMELRGMNARSIMSTGSRESFTALITETLEDPGAGYARLRDIADDTQIWEINLLPLRSDFGMIDRVIGCLHPLTGKVRYDRGVPLRFRIEHMSVETITATVEDHSSAVPVEGFAEFQRPFSFDGRDGGPASGRLTAIDGGRTAKDGTTRPPGRGHLRLVKD